MKKILLPGLLIGILYISSCTKTESFQAQDTYVKAFASENNVVVVATLQLTDGNYLTVSRDLAELDSGYMVKFDSEGNVLWNKRTSGFTTTIWDVILMPGSGFVILGHNDRFSNNINICAYNNDGVIQYLKTFKTVINNSWRMPIDALQMKNGNYAIAGGDIWNGGGNLIITDNSFNLLKSQIYEPIATNAHALYFRGICETADGDLMLSASTQYTSAIGDSSAAYIVLIRTGASGVLKTKATFIDPGYYETSNCLVKYNDGMLGVTAKMIGLNKGNGTFVNYLNSTDGQLISGLINLCRYDKTGQLVERKAIKDYTGNGQINAVKPTSDGGFILCGTVGQANSGVLLSNTKIYLLKIDANLKTQWSRSLATEYPSYGVDVLQMKSGGYLISGYQRSFNNKFEAVVIKTDENGNLK